MVSTRRSSRLQRSTPQPPGSFSREGSAAQPDVTPSKSQGLNDIQIQPSQDTPRGSHNPFSSLLSKLTRTPKHKVAILPAHEEMHPSQHQQSTTKPLDEARWLGFMPMTEPAKRMQSTAVDQSQVAIATPTRVTQSAKAEAFYTPPAELTLNSKRKTSFDAELSPEARRIMVETREEAAKIRAKMTAAKDRQEAQDTLAEQQPVFGLSNPLGVRKIAKPRGRFSDAHKKAFGSMDSIANHASLFRVDQARTTVVPVKVEDTQASKHQLKRTHSKADLGTPQKSGLPVKTSFTPIPARDPALLSPAKRLKKASDVDASTARQSPAISLSSARLTRPAISTATSTNTVKTGIPLPRSHMSTPTKASVARSQSAKSLRHTTSIPTLAKSPSLKNLQKHAALPSQQTTNTTKTPSVEPEDVNKSTLSPPIRSILRVSPKVLYSNDPSKIAAGTHIPTPKRKSFLLKAPATAPVKKHVDFSESTIERAESSESPSSPSVTKFANINKSSETVTIPQSSAQVAYPSLDVRSPLQELDPAPLSRPIAVPKSKLNRRQTLGPTVSVGASAPGNFSFRASGAPSFAAPTAASSIRRVRNSDATAPLSSAPSETITVSKKRKLENVEEDAESSDKENEEKVDLIEEQRPAKKSKSNVQEVKSASKPAAKHEKEAGTAAQRAAKKGPFSRVSAAPATTAGGAKKGGLSMARLAMLAMPKKKRG